MLFHEIHGFIADGDDVVMVGRCAWRNRKTSKVFHSPKVDICHLEGDRVGWFLEAFDTLAFARAAGTV
jgi:ketosteroid isomerase-like protein